MADVELRGVVLDSLGSPIVSADVTLYDADTTTSSIDTTTTDSSGRWGFSESTRGRYDVKIVNNNDTVWLRARDRVQFSTLTLNENATDQEALIVTRSEDAASVEVAIFEGDRATPADNDLAYISLRMSDDGGAQTEIGRIGWVMTDVSNSSEDGDVVLSAMTGGTLTEYLRVDGSGASVVLSGYIVPLITDTDASIEAALWYDASENKLKFYNGSTVETITSS